MKSHKVSWINFSIYKALPRDYLASKQKLYHLTLNSQATIGPEVLVPSILFKSNEISQNLAKSHWCISVAKDPEAGPIACKHLKHYNYTL